MSLHQKKYLFLLITCLMFMACNREEKITLERLLDEMVSFEALAGFPMYTCHQESSYDRASVSPDSAGWFANNDGFGIIRTDTIEGRIENVLFDQTGAGVITRIWLTALNKNGTIRFYFDRQKEAGWVIPAYDMMKFGIPIGRGLLQPHTSYVENGKGGSTLFLPIPYATGCKVTFENPVGERVAPKYYHINYSAYPEGTVIETFSKEVAKRAERKIEEVSRVLLNPVTFQSPTVLRNQRVLHTGEQLVVSLPQGSNAVRTIEFTVEVADSLTYEQVMRELLLEITFDGTQTVRVPLGDFSGGGMGAPLVDSWYLYADGKGKVISRWLMPYKEQAELTLTNYAEHQVNVSADVHTSSFNWKKNTLYFHSAWKQKIAIPLTNNEHDDCIDWNFTTLHGKGIYMGDVLSLFNHSPSWYGEGDEKIYVDYESFPSHFGTGTEDYYNSSWAPVIPFQTPFGGAPRADLESSHGYNTFFRTRNLDRISFKEQLRFDIEMLSWQKGLADYSTTVFWYGELDSYAMETSGSEEFKRLLLLAPEAEEKYKVEGAIEFEDLTPVRKSPSISTDVQNMAAFTSDSWSNALQLLCVGGEEGDSLVFRFDGLKSVPYELEIYMTRAADYGKVQFYINDVLSSVSFDGYSPTVENAKAIGLGNFIAKDGRFELKIELTGTHEASIGNRYFIGLDCLTLKEK